MQQPSSRSLYQSTSFVTKTSKPINYKSNSFKSILTQLSLVTKSKEHQPEAERTPCKYHNINHTIYSNMKFHILNDPSQQKASVDNKKGGDRSTTMLKTDSSNSELKHLVSSERKDTSTQSYRINSVLNRIHGGYLYKGHNER